MRISIFERFVFTTTGVYRAKRDTVFPAVVAW